MSLRKQTQRAQQEPTLALINIVFLMLIFFLIAGTVAPSLDTRVTLVETESMQATPPPDAIVVLADGTLLLRGEEISETTLSSAPDGAFQGLAYIQLVPDAELPAKDLIRIAATLRAAGHTDLRIVTQRGLQ
jgi:biopolymer transport protein ExbD